MLPLGSDIAFGHHILWLASAWPAWCAGPAPGVARGVGSQRKGRWEVRRARDGVRRWRAKQAPTRFSNSAKVRTCPTLPAHPPLRTPRLARVTVGFLPEVAPWNGTTADDRARRGVLARGRRRPRGPRDPERHVVLHAEEDVLRGRIERDHPVPSPFRLRHLEAYAQAARTWLHAEAEVVDNDPAQPPRWRRSWPGRRSAGSGTARRPGPWPPRGAPATRRSPPVDPAPVGWAGPSCARRSAAAPGRPPHPPTRRSRHPCAPHDASHHAWRRSPSPPR